MDPHQSKQIEQLYIEMYDQLKSYARVILESESLAEEAIQEAFQIACQKPQSVCDSENPRGWIVKTLKFTIQNMKRHRATAKRLLDYFVVPQLREKAFSEDSVDLELQYGKIAKTKEFKLVAEMAILGRSHEEMAADRGITVDACKKRMQRSKEFLRNKIK